MGNYRGPSPKPSSPSTALVRDLWIKVLLRPGPMSAKSAEDRERSENGAESAEMQRLIGES